jgi:hypothetical protein
MAALLTKKVEDWLALALASFATDNRLKIYTGEASEETRVRPSVVIIGEGQAVTEPFEWEDNERTAQAAVYIASPADKKLSIHAELCAGLEAALQAVETVKGFASDVPLFYCYYYTIEDSQNESDDGTRTRLTRYNLKVICRDDSGV